MKGQTFSLVLAVFCTSFVTLTQSGSWEVNKIKITTGGSKCIDPEDCHNNGICKAAVGGNGNCNCLVEFAGPNCAVPSKDNLGKALPATGSKGARNIPARKRAKVHTSLKGTKRKLNYDAGSNIYGLTPESLAEAEQPFLIYNPDKKVYCYVSYDEKAVGEHSPYVEARADRFGARNLFKFVKVPATNGKFYIHNIDKNKYIFVSYSKPGLLKFWDSNLFAAESIPTEPDLKKRFMFEFEDEDGDGFYKIKNDGKYLYISSHTTGIPASNLVKATNGKNLKRWSSQYFQFALKEKIKDIVFKVTGDAVPKSKSVDTVIDNQQSTKVCYRGIKGEADQDTKIEFRDDFSEIRSYSRPDGFSFNGELKATYGSASFDYTSTEATAETQKFIKTTLKSASLKLPVNKCACVTITYEAMEYMQPYLLEAKSKEGKTLLAKGNIEGQRLTNFEANAFVSDFREHFRCPHEV
ncbi:uncharacterized protein LOC135681290 [Rhopilema esculentum]|uniref:uncharacterized protein LOC135681290 n=1 Tax=Rhopilema esculentum TaxID=499914 RepID=UPI0031DB915B